MTLNADYLKIKYFFNIFLSYLDSSYGINLIKNTIKLNLIASAKRKRPPLDAGGTANVCRSLCNI